jgi:hypothetical protein
VVEISIFAFPVAADLFAASYSFSDFHTPCNIQRHANLYVVKRTIAQLRSDNNNNNKLQIRPREPAISRNKLGLKYTQ